MGIAFIALYSFIINKNIVVFVFFFVLFFKTLKLGHPNQGKKLKKWLTVSTTLGTVRQNALSLTKTLAAC